MKYLIVVTLVVLLLMPCGCGKEEDTPNTENTVNTVETVKKPKPPAQKEKRAEKSELTVNFNKNEKNAPGAFQLNSTVAFISGMRYNAKATAKLLYVVFANYPVKVSMYGFIVPPAEEGQIAIVTAFKTDNLEIPMQQQMEEYAKMKVPTGEFKPAWMGEKKSFQLSYWVAKKNGEGISGDGASGTATLTTSTPDFASGTIDFTSEKGSTIKGSFEVNIIKDYWKK